MNGIAILYLKNDINKAGQEKYLIEQLREVTTKIYLVCEGKKQDWRIPDEFVLYGKFAHRMDAYRCAFDCFGISQLSYDNLILCDNSFFGPFIPIKEMCRKMDTGKLDCWSISQYPEMYSKACELIPKHIDTSFLYLTKPVIENGRIADFFSKPSEEELLSEEAQLLRLFEEDKIKWTTYIDFSLFVYDAAINNLNWLEELPFSMLEKYGCPVLKKDCFKKNDFRYTSSNEPLTAINYIKEHTTYKEEIIWDYLLEKYDVSDLIDILHLHYVIPECEDSKPVYREKKCAIIVHLTYIKAVDYVMKYIENIPEEIDLYITTKGTECKDAIIQALGNLGRKNYTIRQAGQRGRDISAFLITCKDVFMSHEYVCFVHDKKGKEDLGVPVKADEEMRVQLGNTIKNTAYIAGILRTFEENKQLGILVPPIVYAGGALHVLAYNWSEDYEKALKVKDKLKLQVNISKENYNYSIGTIFWCRTNAMKKLLEADWCFEDFPEEPIPRDGTVLHAVERILLYVAQDAGYYAGIVENCTYASENISNYTYMIRQILKTESWRGGYFDYFLEALDNSERLEAFVKNNKKVYIYGHGEFAHKTDNLLKKLNLTHSGFIVSDGQKKEDGVLYFSDVPDIRDAGIIVAMDMRLKCEVVPMLRQHHIDNIYLVW
jgi:rhamnosyltransferase